MVEKAKGLVEEFTPHSIAFYTSGPSSTPLAVYSRTRS